MKYNLKKQINNNLKFDLKQLKLKQLKQNINNKVYMNKAINELANQIVEVKYV